MDLTGPAYDPKQCIKYCKPNECVIYRCGNSHTKTDARRENVAIGRAMLKTTGAQRRLMNLSAIQGEISPSLPGEKRKRTAKITVDELVDHESGAHKARTAGHPEKH